MPRGVAMLPSWVSAAKPLAPTWAGIPARTASHPAGPRWKMSIFADEPPAPTTETTWVALPTCGANHGVKSAFATGAAVR